ncbi:MAG: hypothetical protein SF029_00690 [bacterium]|nr:hypothetical protein [bacterium]
MTMTRVTALLIGLALLLAACGTTENPSPVSVTVPAEERVVPTLPPAPAWVEPAEVLTLDNIAQARQLGRLDPQGTVSTVFAHDFSSDSTQLVGLNNESLLVWDLITGIRLVNVPRQEAVTVYASSDKTEIYTIGSDGLVLIYDAARGTVRSSVQGSTQYTNVSAYDDNSDLLAMGGLNGEVKVWDMFERQSLVALAGEGENRALAFSADGELLATGGLQGTVQVWNWRERQPIASFELEGDEYAVRLSFSPDGSQVAVGGLSAVFIYDLATQTLLHTLQTGEGSASDVFMYSPDGRYLVNGGVIPDMLVWNPTEGTLVAQLPGVGGDRISAAFSPDGTMLITSRLDGAVSLWNLENATDTTIPRADFDVGGARILYVNWTADGFLMLFFDALGPVYAWGVAPGGEG